MHAAEAATAHATSTTQTGTEATTPPAGAAVTRIVLRHGGAGDSTPAAIAAELTAIYEQEGEITASAVVSAARPETSALHGVFEWDDTKAGHEYRLQQARRLIRALVVENVQTREREPLFIHVTVEKREEGQYLPARLVVQNSDLYIRAVQELRRKVDELLASLAALERMAEASSRGKVHARAYKAAQALKRSLAPLK